MIRVDVLAGHQPADARYGLVVAAGCRTCGRPRDATTARSTCNSPAPVETEFQELRPCSAPPLTCQPMANRSTPPRNARPIRRAVVPPPEVRSLLDQWVYNPAERRVHKIVCRPWNHPDADPLHSSGATPRREPGTLSATPGIRSSSHGSCSTTSASATHVRPSTASATSAPTSSRDARYRK